MARAGIGTPRLWALLMRETSRRAYRRIRSGPVYRWRYAGRTPERVLSVDDLLARMESEPRRRPLGGFVPPSQ